MDFDDVVLVAATNDLTEEPQARSNADAVEFRMDLADDPLDALDAYDGELPILATNRPTWEGGEAEEEGRLDELLTAARLDAVEAVDLELRTARESPALPEDFRAAGADVVVSSHDFERTPAFEDLWNTVEAAIEHGDVAKVAVHAESTDDTLRLLRVVHEATKAGIPVGGMSMGEVGTHTRVVAPLYGSKLTYAPLAADEFSSAPGQLSLDEVASFLEATNADAVRAARDRLVDASRP